MDKCLTWFDDSEERLESEDVIRRLENARNKLTPIIDDIIMSSLDLIHRGDSRFIREQFLTPRQYQDMIWAFTLLKELDYDLKEEKYTLPNTNVIVQNVSVSGKKMSDRDRPVVIDEATVIELLQVYEQMGVIIQRMITTESARTDESTPTDTEVSSTKVVSEKSILKKKSETRFVSEDEDKDIIPPRIKSTLSALLSSSSDNLKKEYSKETTTKTDTETTKTDTEPSRKDDRGDATIFIRIQCFSDCSDQEPGDGAVISCAEKCPSHYHVKLNGKPVTLKMNQANIEDGRVYCINTGSEDENDIRIVIKQCPECKSTVIGSSTKLTDDDVGESHESITLHGKGGDETKMSFSSSDEDIPKKQKSASRTSFSEPIPSRQKLPVKPVTDDDTRSQRTMDVVIDTENVGKSTIKVRETTEEDTDLPERDKSVRSFASVKSSVDALRDKRESIIKPTLERIPLTRRKLCSSLEFDVTKAQTRLREHEIEHKNARIVLELRKLGVDQILRACRPAKCCRKAILNERQRTALPYCVSLRSLPLMGTDVEVIKQSIDMSVKKIKNSLDLTQAYKDKLAFYVSLGREDFRPESNLPWVVPVYDLKHGPGTSKDDDRLFIMKDPIGIPKQLGSLTRLMKVITDLENDKTGNRVTVNNVQCVQRKKYFVLKRPMCKLRNTSDESQIDLLKQRVRRPKRKRRQIKEESSINQDNDKCYTKILECKQTKSIHKKNNVWSNIDRVNWRLIFAQKRKDSAIHCVDFRFGKTQIGYFSEPASRVSLRDTYPSLSIIQKKFHNCGDTPEGSLSTMLDVCFQQFRKEPQNQIIKIDKSVSTPKLPLTLPSRKSIPDVKTRVEKSVSCPKLFKDVCTETSRIVTCVDKEVSAMSNTEKNNRDYKKKRSRNIMIRLDHPLSKTNIITNVSNELLRASKALTNFKMLDKETIVNMSSVIHPQEFEKQNRRYTSAPKVLAQESESRKPIKKKLEYYVNLVDGDLLWSNNLPISPQNYNTYYNFDQDKKRNKAAKESRDDENTNRAEIPIEEPIVVQKVTPEQARRVPTTAKEVEPDSRRSTLSELDIEFAALGVKQKQSLEKIPKQQQKFTNTRPKLPPQYASFPMGPEESHAPWVPFVVSQISLPRLKEKVVIKEEVEQVEAKRFFPPAPAPEPPCSQKATCEKNKCVVCKPSSECKAKKKDCRPKDIKISIRKTKTNDVYVDEMKPGPCDKEICEIYKNKKMVRGKPKKGASKVNPNDRCETFTITAKDNMEIYINKQKICVVNKKSDKPDKNTQEETPDVPEPPTKKDKKRFMC